MRRFTFALVAAALLSIPSVALPADEVAFASPPQAVRSGDQFKIAFALTAAADVEIAVLDAKGEIVRHLAAGMVGGKTAAAPLAPNSLRQEIAWDGKDDLGQPVKLDGATVRLRAGSNAQLEKMLGAAPGGFFGGVETLAVGPTGELFVLNCELFKFGRAELIVLDRDGKYLRTSMPYAADTPKERTESVGQLTLGGQRVPLLYSGHTAAVYPLTVGMRSQTMAWHPKGYLIAASALGSAREHGPARHLLAFHPAGGAPPGVSFVGPRIQPPRGFLGGGGERDNRGLDRVAVSPDGEWIYLVTAYEGMKNAKHGVYRCKWADATVGELWLGKPEAGDDDEHFNSPQGVAVAPDGRLFICDRGNNRVKVYSADSKLLGAFPCDTPEQIVIDPKSSRLFVLARPEKGKSTQSKLVAFEAFTPGEGAKKLFELPTNPNPIRAIGLDASGAKPRLWIVQGGPARRTGKCVPVTIAADKFELGEPVKLPAPLDAPSFIAATPDGKSVLVKEHFAGAAAGFRKFDVASGQAETLAVKGYDVAIDRTGNLYTLDGYNTNSISRYDAAGKPLPFEGSASNKLDVKFSAYGPDMAARGQCVDLRGNLYVMRFESHIIGGTLDVFGADGKLKKANLVAGLGSADSGLGVDAAGNIYLGVNVKNADAPLPPPFAGMVPALNWIWWRNPAYKREAPWWHIYCNTYLFHMGQVFKFGPEGGTFYGNQQPVPSIKAVPYTPGTELDKAPANAESLKTGYLTKDVKVAGAQWHYPGVGSIGTSSDGPAPDPGCTCLPSHLTADLWGRTFAPNCFLFGIDMIDPAGNLIRRIGQYGTNDAPADEIRFLQPTACSYAKDRLFVSDTGNRRVLVIALKWTAETSVAAK